MGPPEDSEYAVDPVGVERIKPSDYSSRKHYEAGTSCTASRGLDTHDRLSKMLAVNICVDYRQMRASATMKSHFIHELKS